MAGMCCGIKVGENEPASPVEPVARTARRRRLEMKKLRIISNIAETTCRIKRRKVEDQEVKFNDQFQIVPLRDCENVIENDLLMNNEKSVKISVDDFPKFGVTSVCGRRRDMEDAVSIRPSFCKKDELNNHGDSHFYGVFDGHGCFHVILYNII